MSITTPLSDPPHFTSLEPLVETRLWEDDLFQPDERLCPFCDSRLTTYKTIPARTICTLTGPRTFSELQLCCPNLSCPSRPLDPQSDHPTPLIFKSPLVQQLVLPKMYYGLDVVLEVGRRSYTDPKPGPQLQLEFSREFGFAPSLASIYRYKDLFEALSLGILTEHEPTIAAKLQQQSTFVLTFDATEYHGGSKLYRAVDFLSGFCLGTLLIPVGNKAQLRQWQHDLYHRFGFPDYQVTDGEAALHPDSNLGSGIPHQDCWYHVLTNVWEVLTFDWRAEAKGFLQQTHYRKDLTHLLQELETHPFEAWPPHGKSLRSLLEFFLAPPAGSSGWDDPLALRLAQFQEARTLLTRWARVLKGRRSPHEESEAPLLTTYRELKAQLPPQERADYFAHKIFATDPCFQVFLRFKARLDEICTDKRFKALLRHYKRIDAEFQTLRSWLLQAVIRRNEAYHGVPRLEPPTSSDARLRQLLAHSTARARAELAKIPQSLQAWQWRGEEPALPLEEKATRLLQRLLTRWAAKSTGEGNYAKAAALLRNQLPFLLTFFQNAAIPVSNQALETDHGQLKQLWRRSAGGQDRAYTLVYHGHASSMTRNCVRGPGEASPLEILGFPPEVIEQWYYTCALAQLEAARATMTTVRKARRLRLQVARQSLQEAFKGSAQVWLEWAAHRLAAYLAQTAS